MNLWFWFCTMTAYPFVIGGCVYDPFIYATVSAVVKQRFRCWVGSRMGVPQGDKFLWIAIHFPTAITDDTGNPMTFFIAMDTHPVMLAACRLDCFCFCRLCSWRCCFRRLRYWRLCFRRNCFNGFGIGWSCRFCQRLGR